MFVQFLKGEKHAAKDAPQSKNLSSFEDAGYILKDNEIVVDIDNLPKRSIQALIDTFDLKCEVVWTERGAHLYFLKPSGWRGSEGICALGFKVECKHSENTFAVTVKRNGVARERVNPGRRQKLPEFLFPKEKFKESLVGYSEDGDEGRNSALFAWTSRVYGMRDRERILRFINEHVFAEPLPEKEFQEVTRPRAPRADKDMENEIADCVISDLNVTYYAGQVYFLDTERDEYVSDINDLEYAVYQYCSGQKSRYVKEVIEQLKMRCPRARMNDGFPIAFDNGYLKDGKFIGIKYRGFTPYRIHSPYDPDAEPVETVDQYLDQLTDGNGEYRQLLLETIAHGLITDKERKRMLSKFFVFIGQGGNGKGTFLQVIRKIFGEKNCGALSVQEMSDERYFNTLSNKLFNLGDDLDDAPINNSQMRRLKNVSTCDTVEVRRLYENSTTCEIFSTLIFTSNHLIKSFEKGESYKRRVLWMPMFGKPKTPDPHIITKLTTPEAVRYWFRLIVEGYQRLYENGFTSCEVVDRYTEYYHYENDNTIPFVETLQDAEVYDQPANELFVAYEAWCHDNGENPGSRKRLYETVRKTFNVEKKYRRIKGYGRQVYVFVKK